MGFREKYDKIINNLLNYQFVFSKVLIVLFFFYYQGQKGEPGDIVDVSMNPLQVVILKSTV